MPMVLNAANTGNYNEDLRIGTSFSNLRDASVRNIYINAIKNNISNFSIENKLGKKKDWALGLNFMHSGSPSFIMSGNYYAASVSKLFFLDSAKVYSLRLGAQAVYLTGVADENKGSYSILLDVRAFQHYRPEATIGNGKFNANYFNLNLGSAFKINLEKFQFETGVSVNNILKPNFGIMYDDNTAKRYRTAINSTASFMVNKSYSFRIDHISWKEGLFARGSGQLSDTTDIHETIFGVTMINKAKSNKSIGLFTRTSKTFFIIAGVDLMSKLTLNLSYELPFNKRFYNVNQYGMSLIYKSKQKK
jgi:hypothetical protein